MEYKIELVTGDWSSDGHGISESSYFLSNYSKERINQAYEESVKLTGINFKSVVARDYGESRIDKELYDKLLSFGMTDVLELNDEDRYDDDDEEYEYYVDGTEYYCQFYIEFVKLSLPDLVMEQTCLDYEVIRIGGYGLYTN